VRTAIITYLDKNFYDQLTQDFIPTLFEDAAYSGELFIVDLGLTQNQLKELSKNTRIIIVKNKMPKTESKGWSEEISNARIEPILNLITHKLREYTHIMTIDAGDVWFQDNFEEVFELCSTKIGFVEENEKWTQGWSQQVMKKIPQPKRKSFQDIVKDNNIIGSGMICGPRHKMISLFDKWLTYLNMLDKHFGIDQLALNCAVHNIGYKNFLPLPHTYDFVMILKLNWFGITPAGTILDNKNNKVKIVHCAGGQNRLFNSRKEMMDKIKNKLPGKHNTKGNTGGLK